MGIGNLGVMMMIIMMIGIIAMWGVEVSCVQLIVIFSCYSATEYNTEFGSNTIFICRVVDTKNDGQNTVFAGLVTVDTHGTVALMVGGGIRDFGNHWYVRQDGEWKATLKSLHNRLGLK